jgi:hypothetical protein
MNYPTQYRELFLTQVTSRARTYWVFRARLLVPRTQWLRREPRPCAADADKSVPVAVLRRVDSDDIRHLTAG